MPNPSASAIFRAGDLADRSTYYRDDLVRAEIPTAPVNPHSFLTSITSAAACRPRRRADRGLLRDRWHGMIDPDGPAGPAPSPVGTFFEVPIVGDLPEGLNF